MDTLILSLIFFSALIHATWNVWMRHLKGNTPVLIFAHIIGSIMFLPITSDLFEAYHFITSNNRALLCLASSLSIHSMYLLLLSAAYLYGDVGLVYPLARGSAIILATLASQVLNIGEKLNAYQIFGIFIVVFGIWTLCFEAISSNNINASLQDKDAVNSSSRGHYEMVPVSDSGVERLESTELGIAGYRSSPSIDHSADLNVSESDSIGSPEVSSNDLTIEARGSTNKTLVSIALAAVVGVLIATYSVLDSFGVENFASAESWSFFTNFVGSVLMLPIMFVFYKEETMVALNQYKLSILLISPMVIGAYMIILYVFGLPGTNVALVVAFREFAILIGAFFAVVFLKESISIVKFVSIIIILIGFVVLKVG